MTESAAGATLDGMERETVSELPDERNLLEERLPLVLTPNRGAILRVGGGMAALLALCPILLGVLAFLFDRTFNSHTLQQSLNSAVELVGWSPVWGLGLTLLLLPGFWIVLRQSLARRWVCDGEGIRVFEAGSEHRFIPWANIRLVILTSFGPNLLVRNEPQGQMLTFAPSAQARALYRLWRSRVGESDAAG